MLNEFLQFVLVSPYKLVGAALAGGLVVHTVFWFVLGLIARRTRSLFDDALITHLKTPTRFLLPLLAVKFVQPQLQSQMGEPSAQTLRSLLTATAIALFAWMLVRLGAVFEKVVMSHQGLEKPDNLNARRIYTQIRILRRVLGFIVWLIASGLILMTFDEFRRLGTGLLASAGVVGLVLGFAAQRALGNLFAGIQIAITQPIRHDDVVVVENEWGVIEEITLTYVVVRIWDLRRLIVPISHFIEKPFQNWTRTSSKVLGTVFLWVDYSIPLDRLREELSRIVHGSPHWDKDVQQIVVTNCDQKAMELRVLVSASSGPLCWDLRVEVREKLLAFIQKNFKASLPVLRAEVLSR